MAACLAPQSSSVFEAIFTDLQMFGKYILAGLCNQVKSHWYVTLSWKKPSRIRAFDCECVDAMAGGPSNSAMQCFRAPPLRGGVRPTSGGVNMKRAFNEYSIGS